MVELIKKRTKAIGLSAIEISKSIPHTREGDVIAKQLIRCGTAVGANYRAALRAKSKPDFIYKLKVVEEEADETIFWLEMLEESRTLTSKLIDDLKKETDTILALIVKTIKTSISNQKNS
jgi:four helix bundle protein